MLQRSQKRIGTLVCFVFAIFALLAFQATSAEPFKRTASGWVHPTAIDANANGEPLFTITTFGKGTFGKSVTRMSNETVFESIGFGCGDYPADVFAFKVVFISSTLITRFEKGDMLFATLDTEGPSSFVCFDLTASRNSANINLVITGGTGRFENATGWLNIRNYGTPLWSTSGEWSQVALEVESIGEVFLD